MHMYKVIFQKEKLEKYDEEFIYGILEASDIFEAEDLVNEEVKKFKGYTSSVSWIGNKLDVMKPKSIFWVN